MFREYPLRLDPPISSWKPCRKSGLGRSGGWEVVALTTAAHAGRIGGLRSGLRRLKRERIDLLSALRPKRRLLLVVVVRVAVVVGLVVTTDFVLRRGDHMS